MTSDFGCIPQFDGGEDLIDLDVTPTTTPSVPGRVGAITGILLFFIFLLLLCFLAVFCLLVFGFRV